MTPNWSALCRLAAPQLGYFHRTQAHTVGYSRQLMKYYIEKSLIERTTRDGVFHLTRFPRGEREELIVLWLTTEGRGVFSHETALWLHGLLDHTPTPHTMTLPPEWRRRRRPEGVRCHLDQLPPDCLETQGALPLTSPVRSLADCLLRATLRPDPMTMDGEPDGVDMEPLLRKAISRAVQRGLCTRAALRRLVTERRQVLLTSGRSTGASGAGRL